MPRWTEACKELHSHFLDSSDREIVDELIVSTDTVRCQKWVETIKLLTSKIKPSSILAIMKYRRSLPSGTQSRKKFFLNKETKHTPLK